MADLMTLRRSIIASNAKKPVPKTYGVEWNYADPSTVLTRTGAAANFANPIPAESLNEVGWSPFDSIYPWSEMKRYNIINGEVAYSEDDAGYSETDYDTMVYIPEFYYYANKDTVNQKWNWSISATPLAGYAKHPGSGRYVGRFHTSGSSSGVFSKSGTSPLVNNTRANYRTYSHSKGSKWWQIDLATWSAIQFLYLIEFANWNSQDALGRGNNTGSIKNNGATTMATYCTVKQTGASGNMYRWIENPYSNALIWVDGFVPSNRIAYISTNNATFSDTIDGMKSTGITIPNTEFITGLGYSDVCAWAFIPDNSGSSSSYIPDYVFFLNGAKCLDVGGAYDGYNYAGFFCFCVDTSANDKNSMLGSRLIYIPTT